MNTTGLLQMSQKELTRLEYLEKLNSKQVSQIEAAKLMGVSTRHLRRLQQAYRLGGAKALISKRRGQPSNHRLPSDTKKIALALIQKHYPDFGPTLAHEKLTEKHKVKISLESLRQLMIKVGIWKGKKRRLCRVHQMRSRRSCLGELIQIDGSPHAWFEERGARCCLLVFVDDATGRIMSLHFEKEESAQGYFDATYQYIMAHGVPDTFYSDKHGIFRVNIKEAQSGNGETQFSRALRELDITLINANSPQAKGRVENKNGTLQDRLVKELRLENISDIESANAFLPAFIEDYNRRFAKIPASAINRHRKRSLAPKALRTTLSYQNERTITKNLEVHYQNKIYQIQSKKPSYTMRHAKVIVCHDHEKITLIYKGKELPYKIFDHHNQTTPIASSKQINEILDNKKSSTQKSLKTPYKPSNKHPWRKSFSSKNKKQSQATL